MEFEWDRRKAKYNQRKHHVRFEEAHTVFADPLARIFDDPDHSAAEERELIIGALQWRASPGCEFYRACREDTNHFCTRQHEERKN